MQYDGDPNLTVMSICSNMGNYAESALFETRFVPEVRNFIWAGGMHVKDILHATVTNTNRVHLQRLNLFQTNKTITLARFIASLGAGEEVSRVFHKGYRSDFRMSSLSWTSTALHDNLDNEFENIVFYTVERMP
jgi:hypothetical protein